MCKTSPQEEGGGGYNYYITCYIDNITVEEVYGQHSYMLPR